MNNVNNIAEQRAPNHHKFGDSSCEAISAHGLIASGPKQLSNEEAGEKEMVRKNICLHFVTRAALFIAAMALFGAAASAQTPTPTPTPAATPTATSTPAPAATPQPSPLPVSTANPADVATMDAIVAALYDVISGPPGKRDWDRFRSLFYPGARLIPTGTRATGEIGSRVMSPDDYAGRNGPFLEKNGFFEREISRRTEKFANIAHLFSTYESRHAKEDEKPFARGINSIQMMNDGKRWWILSIFWQAEDPKNQLPAEYLRTRN